MWFYICFFDYRPCAAVVHRIYWLNNQLYHLGDFIVYTAQLQSLVGQPNTKAGHERQFDLGKQRLDNRTELWTSMFPDSCAPYAAIQWTTYFDPVSRNQQDSPGHQILRRSPRTTI